MKVKLQLQFEIPDHWEAESDMAVLEMLAQLLVAEPRTQLLLKKFEALKEKNPAIKAALERVISEEIDILDSVEYLDFQCDRK